MYFSRYIREFVFLFRQAFSYRFELICKKTDVPRACSSLILRFSDMKFEARALATFMAVSGSAA